jgi:hypothetical protein
MATVELEREARNNRSVGTNDEDQDEDEALVRSSCREEIIRQEEGAMMGEACLQFVLCTCTDRTLLPW